MKTVIVSLQSLLSGKHPHILGPHLWFEVLPSSWLCWLVTKCVTQKPKPLCQPGLATEEIGLSSNTVKNGKKGKCKEKSSQEF